MVALAVLLVSGPCAAVGLGEMEVQSALNEPFRARIALRGLKPGEIENLQAALGDDAAFERAGLARSHLLTKLRFAARATGDRRGHVLVTSRELIREPSLSFVVAVSALGQVVQRRYDVVLNLD
jgi:pilus assembly protein FimV